MNENDPKGRDDLLKILESMRSRLRVLTVAVILMTLVLILTVAAVYGSLVNYFAGDARLFGGVSVGAALLGFGFGWFAGRRA